MFKHTSPIVGSIFFFILSSCVNTAYASTSELLTGIQPPPPDVTYHLFQLESEDVKRNCADWTYHNYLFPNDYNYVNYTKVNDSHVVRARWEGNFPIFIHHPYSKQCMYGRKATDEQLEQPANVETMLCTTLHDDKVLPRKTVILHIDPETYHWHDIIDNDRRGGLNMWHFHAQMFPIWLSIRLSDVSTTLLSQHPQFNHSTSSQQPIWLPSTIASDDYDVIFLFPDVAYERLNKVDKLPFLITTHKLIDLQNNYQGEPSPLTGLQAINDGLKGRVIIGAHSTTAKHLFDIMKQHNMEPRANVWLTPPGRNGYMWHLERYNLEDHMSDMDNCNTKLFTDYLSNYISSVPVKYPNTIATHVCYMSRQSRVKSFTEEKPKSRNLLPQLFLDLMKRLASPIILSPHVNLRTTEEELTKGGFPFIMASSSLTGQMRFVHEECAVLVGVHGAGLAHVMGLRPGAHLFEIYGRKQYTIFKNSAHLMNNVTYSTYQLDSEMGDRENEFDFSATEQKLDELVKIIHSLLDESIERQKIIFNDKKNQKR